MQIRDEEPGDDLPIRAVIEAAFLQPLEADLVDQLRADGDTVISLVAVEDDQIVGHVLFSRMSAPFRALGLAPAAVMPEYQRTGVGSGLILAGLERAGQEGWQGIFVLGDPEYYRRFGFDPALAEGFATSYAGPYLMALALDGELPETTGRIDYAPAFAGLE